MKVLLSGGGTAGHVNPALAIADLIKAHDKRAEIAFVGTKKGIENRLCEKAGYPIYHIEVKGLKRSLSLSNIKTAYYYFTAPKKAKKLLLEYKPDIVIGTGGFVCWPLLSAATKLGIPTALHESNAIPGKAVKMLADKVDRIYVNFASTMEYFADKSKVLFVGNPMMQKSTAKIPENIREILNIPEGTEKILLSFGGSLGAARLNSEIIALMKNFSSVHPEVFHIHATGSSSHEKTVAAFRAAGLEDCRNLRLTEYIYDMPYWERLSDAVICRAGAMTVSEMALQKKACILIPSPNVANNHQYENAKRLADANAAIMIEEKHLCTDMLEKCVCDILYDREKASAMRENIAAFAKTDANELIWRDIKILLSRDIMKLLESK